MVKEEKKNFPTKKQSWLIYHHRSLIPIKGNDGGDISGGCIKHYKAVSILPPPSLLTDGNFHLFSQVTSDLDGEGGGCVIITACGDSREAERIQSTSAPVWHNDRPRNKTPQKPQKQPSRPASSSCHKSFCHLSPHHLTKVTQGC